jgi:hypothetical protein
VPGICSALPRSACLPGPGLLADHPILRTGDDRLWLVVGIVAGIGLFDSDLIAFLLAAVVVGLAVAGPRRPFGTVWLYAGGAIAIGLWLPYLVWQASHGWPELAIARSIASGGSGTSAPRWALLPLQLRPSDSSRPSGWPAWCACCGPARSAGAARWASRSSSC